MTAHAVERQFRQKVCEKVRLAEEGLGRFRVFTPFQFEDGDHLAIVLRRDGDRWVLCDEGHTYMHLTYDLDEKDLQKGARAKIITNALSAFLVEDRDGELALPVPDEQFGDALYTFVQAILKISDVTFLSRERVRSTFFDDFRAFVCEKVPAGRMTFDWHDPDHDPDARYPVDCRVNGTSKPLLVYALPTDDRVRDATISLLQFERWGRTFRSLGGLRGPGADQPEGARAVQRCLREAVLQPRRQPGEDRAVPPGVAVHDVTPAGPMAGRRTANLQGGTVLLVTGVRPPYFFLSFAA